MPDHGLTDFKFKFVIYYTVAIAFFFCLVGWITGLVVLTLVGLMFLLIALTLIGIYGAT